MDNSNSDNANAVLRQAIAYIRAGHPEEARPLLADFVRQHPKSDAGWFLLSQTLSEPKQQTDCLRQALRVNPHNTLARQALERLQSGGTLVAPPAAPPIPPAPAAPKPTPPPAASSKPGTLYVSTPPPDPSLDFWVEDEPAPPEPPAAAPPQADLPSWLAGTPPAGSQAAPPPAKSASTELPPWLAEPPAKSASNELPPWLAEPPAKSAQPAAVQPSAAASNLPDWLEPFSAGEAPGSQNAVKSDNLNAVENRDLNKAEGRDLSKAEGRGQNAVEGPAAPPIPASGPAEKPAATPRAAERATPRAATGPTPSEAAQKAKARSPARKKRSDWMAIAVLGGVLLVGILVVGAGVWFFFFSGLLSNNTAIATEEPAPVAVELPSATQEDVLPPTWTPTPTLAPTATRTITPIPEPTLTPTFLPPPPTALAQMDLIQQQVADLRGLSIVFPVPRYVLPKMVAEKMLRSELENEATLTGLKNDALALSALGLIKPTYDIVSYAMNGLVDNIGGFYRHDTQVIYVLGIGFGAMEHLIYSHEFDHALVDQHFSLAGMKSSENCANNDRCQAITALIEGDATLTMAMWLKQYASPRDYLELSRYRFPAQALPEQFPPDYVIYDLNFPYESGLAFVTDLYDKGNWAKVNDAYYLPPQSTEQIIHPEKYASGEAPIPVQDAPLSNVLPAPWRMAKTNTLGEWTTYLMLAYGADKFSQQPPKQSADAAKGWGGDQYQVYYNDQTQQTALAVHWVWDTPADANQIIPLMEAYLDGRFRGAKLDRPIGKCWEANSQTTCLYSSKTETLWLFAPDQATIDLMFSLYSGFTTP